MSDTGQSELASLWREMLHQQTSMVQVMAKSVRLPRLLVERLLGAQDRVVAPRSRPEADGALAIVAEPSFSTVPPPRQSVVRPEVDDVSHLQGFAGATTAGPADAPTVESSVAAPLEQTSARGARYYQPRPSPSLEVVQPEQLELMRRLQEMREAGDLILQFGPYKGTPLAQVALNHPEYIRQLVTGAQRPEVRAAASRLVEALDAAGEHKRKTSRGTSRRPRSVR
jgi:hypothetical protein